MLNNFVNLLNDQFNLAINFCDSNKKLIISGLNCWYYINFLIKCREINYLFKPESDSWVSWKLMIMDQILIIAPELLYKELILEIKINFIVQTT